MKTLRLPVLLGFVLLMIAFGLLFSGYRLYVYTLERPFSLTAVLASLKVLIYMALVVFGVCLYRLLRYYERNGFFDSTSIQLIRWIGYAVVLIAMLNPIFLAVENRVEYGGSLQGYVLGTLIKFVLESPLMLLVGLLTYLLTDFMQKAITVKRDNESFI